MADRSSRAAREAFERTTTGGDELSWALRSVLWSYNDVVRQVASRMRLNVNDVSALEHLIERPELGPADLAQLLGMTTPSATVLVDRLVGAGHLERHPHPSDRRRRRLVVTEHARGELAEALAPLFDALDELDASVAPDDAAVVIAYLRSVGDVYERFLDGPAPGDD